MRAFRKMHGLGNDFVIIDARQDRPDLDADKIRHIADRHFGIGCDQLIILEPPRNPNADIFMRIYNPDGDEAEACGNATRCVMSLLMEETGKSHQVIQTLRGNLDGHDAGNGMITIDMGPPQLDWQDIPLSEKVDIKSLPIATGPLCDPVGVGMGNPHCVFFVQDAESVNLEKLGPEIEHHPLFPNRTNVEIASLQADGSLRVRVWERGAGMTLACGSGACAVSVAAFLRALTQRRTEIQLDGGRLHVEWLENGHVLMTGPVATAFKGELDL